MKMYNTSNICPKQLFYLSWCSSGRVPKQLSEGHKFESTSYFHESLLQTTLTITPPSPSSCIIWPKNQWRPLFSLLSLNSSMPLAHRQHSRHIIWAHRCIDCHSGAKKVITCTRTYIMQLRKLSDTFQYTSKVECSTCYSRHMYSHTVLLAGLWQAKIDFDLKRQKRLAGTWQTKEKLLFREMGGNQPNQ